MALLLDKIKASGTKRTGVPDGMSCVANAHTSLLYRSLLRSLNPSARWIPLLLAHCSMEEVSRSAYSPILMTATFAITAEKRAEVVVGCNGS
mgnify:CR=1 FL=1